MVLTSALTRGTGAWNVLHRFTFLHLKDFFEILDILYTQCRLCDHRSDCVPDIPVTDMIE